MIILIFSYAYQASTRLIKFNYICRPIFTETSDCFDASRAQYLVMIALRLQRIGVEGDCSLCRDRLSTLI